MIQLDAVKRQFGGRVLFERLSWLIRPGARIGLVGPNGTGKTTLLRILDGRELPDAGRVHKPSTLHIGYLPQEVETVECGSVLAVVLAGSAELARIESDLEQVGEALTHAVPGGDEASRLTERYGALRQRFEQLDGDRLEARAKAILSGLGVATREFHAAIDTLSGGWRMRVILARLLLGTPDLLLLDEPTNHLDLEAIDWLESFLDGFAGAFVVVSHDRYFLNRMVRDTVELERGRLTVYPGNYESYLESKQERAEALEQAAKQQARELKKTERFIERFRYKNTKARQVQSRVRALSKVERIETTETRRSVRFGFPAAPRSGDVVVRGDAVTKRFGSKLIYDGMDLTLRRGERVALIGPNGAGKSTLLKMLAGRLQPDGGTLELGHNVVARYYAQHQLDDLNPRSTLLEEMQRAAPGEPPLRLRKLLGCFLFSGEEVDKHVSVLSGGEKARLALARLLIHPANLLLLDEPTNHLDLQSREVLEEALNEYENTLVVVSHDRYFINRVVTSIGVVERGSLELYPGDYDEYLDWTRRRAAEPDVEIPDTLERAPAGEVATPSGAERKVARRRAAEERNRLHRERRAEEQRLAPVETEISEAERELARLEALLADAEVYRNPERAAEVGRARAEIDRRLAELYARWESLSGG